MLKIETIIFVAVVCVKIVTGTIVSTECINMTNAHNLSIGINSGFNHTKYFMQQSSMSDDIPEEWVNIAFRSSHGPDNKQCPKHLPRGDYPVMMRSTCPWYIKLNYDPKRFPSTIPHAISRCQTCIGSDGSKKCEPIRRTINVFRQTEDCGDGLYRYKKEEINIIIAYVCTVPKEIESSFNLNNDATVSSTTLASDDPIAIA